MTPAPSLDVVVVTHDTRELTLRCVESVLAAGSAGEAEIRCTVVDNASRDGTAEALAERFGDRRGAGDGIVAAHPGRRLRLIRNEQNLGYGAACNSGLARGTGEIVLILNSDVVARPGAIGRLTGFLASAPGHVAAGGRLVDPGTDSPQVGHNVRAFPRLGPQLAQMLGLERHWPGNPLSRRYLLLDFDYSRTQDVEQPAGSCLACRRVDFEAVGGFDERFFYWYEDVDLVRRLHARGRVAYVHDATFEHVGGATFAQWGRPESILSWYPSLFRYFDKHRPWPERTAVRAVAFVLALIRAGLLLFRDRRLARACLAVGRMAIGGRRAGAREA